MVMDVMGPKRSFDTIYDSPKSNMNHATSMQEDQLARNEMDKDSQLIARQQLINIDATSYNQEIRSTVDLKFELENGLVRGGEHSIQQQSAEYVGKFNQN